MFFFRLRPPISRQTFTWHWKPLSTTYSNSEASDAFEYTEPRWLAVITATHRPMRWLSERWPMVTPGHRCVGGRPDIDWPFAMLSIDVSSASCACSICTLTAKHVPTTNCSQILFQGLRHHTAKRVDLFIFTLNIDVKTFLRLLFLKQNKLLFDVFCNFLWKKTPTHWHAS